MPQRTGAIFLLTGFLAVMAAETARAEPILKLQKAIPRAVMGWAARAGDRLFDERSIFEYIDGAGEVYRAYGMRRCLSRVYARQGRAEILLDVFDMGSSADAFGVFTHDTEGEAVPIGQDGRWRPGWLNFWKGRFFVSVTVQEESAEAGAAARELGSAVAARITGTGERPALLARLPRDGLVRASIRYLHHPIVLNYHFYLADENILGLTPHTAAVLARYGRPAGAALLLLVQYPDAAAARAAAEGLRRHYLPDADETGAARLENGKWAAAQLNGSLLSAVLEADSRETARGLVREAR